MRKISRSGPTRDHVLGQEELRAAAKAEIATRLVAGQLAEEMRRQGLTKARLAQRMNTSRAQIDRILLAKGNVTVETLRRAAALVGRALRVELT